MNAEENIVRLSISEVTYLKSAGFLPRELMRLIEEAPRSGNDTHAISISRDAAEQFRAAFTERLAVKGFDKDYEPTSEGKLLEDLIDRFHREFR